MRSKDYLKQIAESKGVSPLTNEVKDNALLFPIGFEYIFQDLDRLEKLEKTLEIIKTKCATNTNLWLVFCTRTYEDYESFVENKGHKLVRLEHNILTQQEYELLKGVLKDE